MLLIIMMLPRIFLFCFVLISSVHVFTSISFCLQKIIPDRQEVEIEAPREYLFQTLLLKVYFMAQDALK